MSKPLSNHFKIISIASGIGVAILGVVFASRCGVFKQKRVKTSLMEALKKPSVHVKDMERVERMLQTFIEGGHQRMQVIADWDWTITRCRMDDGSAADTCHNALDNSKHLPEFYKKEAIQLRDHYMAIEFDHNRTVEEKYPYMVEWWTKAHNLLVQCNMTRSTLTQIISESNILLRLGCDWMFKELYKAEIPLLIFSAGIGDVIEEVVKQQGTLYDNMRIVSNYMDFNSHGTLVGFQGELIHTFNKNENSIHNSDYFEKLVHRDNVILMGDTLGDLRMAEGCDKNANVLKIGFLNDKVEQLLPSYMDAYDVVLVKDETMEVPNAILKQVL